jgi:DNA invertase Pin-like site-specific DNA recombinase
MSKIINRIKKFFKKKELTELEKELNKYPKKDRPKLKKLMEDWENGKYIKVYQKGDNKWEDI